MKPLAVGTQDLSGVKRVSTLAVGVGTWDRNRSKIMYW